VLRAVSIIKTRYSFVSEQSVAIVPKLVHDVSNRDKRTDNRISSCEIL
jgi:hypothetical protein